MVICQYFLRGACKFGDRCRNEHRRPDNRGSYTNRGSYNQDFFSGSRGGHGGHQGYQGQKSGYQDGQGFGGGDRNYGSGRGGRSGGRDRYQYDTRSSGSSNRYAALSHQLDPEFSPFDQRPQPRARSNSSNQHASTPDQRLERVRKDIKEWEQSGQWPLSCYASVASDSSFEGLVDISPEEVRFEAYKARAEGNVAGYAQSLQQTMEKYIHRKRELSNMSAFSLQHELSSSTQLSVAAPGGLFGNLAPSTTPFGSKQTSIFGAPMATTTTSTGLFGSASQSSSNFGPFASSPFTTTSSDPFASSSGPSSGPFASSSGPSSGPFASSSGPSSGPFASSSGPSSSPFTSSSGFSSGPFGSSSGTALSTQSSTMSIVDGSEDSKSAATTSHEAAKKTVIATLRCREQDLKAFKADHFVLGAIPECPPPPELC